VNAFTQPGTEPGLKAAAEALEAHFPCAGCAGATSAETMCPQGSRLYREQLAALDAATRLDPAPRVSDGQAPTASERPR
jgi:hypothetical protein